MKIFRTRKYASLPQCFVDGKYSRDNHLAFMVGIVATEWAENLSALKRAIAKPDVRHLSVSTTSTYLHADEASVQGRSGKCLSKVTEPKNVLICTKGTVAEKLAFFQRIDFVCFFSTKRTDLHEKYDHPELEVAWWEQALWLLGLLVLIPLMLLLAPIFILATLASWGWFYRKSLDARLTESGITVFSRAKGEIASYAWADVAEMRRGFRPPIQYPVLVLASGEMIHLESADLRDLAASLESRGIRIDLENRLELPACE